METNCANCQKEINIRPANYKEGRNFCSRECFNTSGLPRPNRKTGITKNCEVCGKEFYTQKSTISRKYCGRKCKGIASRLPMNTCENCGKEFKPEMGRSDQRFCSRQCFGQNRRQGIQSTCDQCGRDIYISQSRYKNHSNHFCNMTCANLWQGRNKTVHTCKVCKKEFKWSPSRSTSGNYNIKYCSLECRDNDPTVKKQLVKMNVDQQKSTTPNKLEKLGYSLLDEVGIEYIPQHLIANKFCVDAFIPSFNTIIQFDGDYWHGNPAKYTTLDYRQEKRAKLDKSQDAYMKKCGYTVIRFWGSDIKNNTDHVRQVLSSLVQT